MSTNNDTNTKIVLTNDLELILISRGTDVLIKSINGIGQDYHTVCTTCKRYDFLYNTLSKII